MQRAAPAATALAGLAAALVSGFFYAYHCSVMIGFEAADPVVTITAMQAINATVRNASFAFSFFGTLGFGLIASLLAIRSPQRRSSWAIWTGTLLYLIGGFGVTIIFNVPLNETLAPVRPEPETASAVWQAYAAPWQFWNTVRMIASAFALGVFVWALRLDGQGKSQS